MWTRENNFWEHQLLSNVVLTVLGAGLRATYGAYVLSKVSSQFLSELFLTDCQWKLSQRCCPFSLNNTSRILHDVTW